MRNKVLLLCLLVLFLENWLLHAQELNSIDKVSGLKGIRSLSIFVEKFSENTTKIGLSKERIATVAELRLRKEGIDIGRPPSLYINIQAKGPAFCIQLKLVEPVHPSRDNSITCLGSTWDITMFGMHGESSEYIINSLNNLLDYFLNDFYKANPKNEAHGGQRSALRSENATLSDGPLFQVSRR